MNNRASSSENVARAFAEPRDRKHRTHAPQVADLVRGDPAARRLGEALLRSPAFECWTLALLAMDYGLGLPEGTPLAETRAVVGVWVWWSKLAALCVANDPTLTKYFRTPNRVEYIWHWLEYRAFQSRGIELPDRELYAWTQPGPRPGPKPQRRKHSDEWIAQREAQVRTYWRSQPPYREPNEIELTDEIPIHPRTYRRYLLRKQKGAN